MENRNIRKDMQKFDFVSGSELLIGKVFAPMVSARRWHL